MHFSRAEILKNWEKKEKIISGAEFEWSVFILSPLFSALVSLLFVRMLILSLHAL